jgi:hypothetical protein
VEKMELASVAIGSCPIKIGTNLQQMRKRISKIKIQFTLKFGMLSFIYKKIMHI